MTRSPLLLLACLAALSACTPRTPPHAAAAGPGAGDVLPVGAVQGRGDASPRVGEAVTVEGVVTLRLREAAGHAVFLQDAGDGDAATSDALLLAGPGADALDPGQAVRARGRVVELDTGGGATLTALVLEDATVLPRRAQPDALRLPPAQLGEAHEGMRVVFESLLLAGHARMQDDGVLLASAGALPFTPTELARPGSDEARAIAARNAATRVLLDDAVTGGPPEADAPWPALLHVARTGSTLGHVEGVLDHREGGWRVQLARIGLVEPAPRPDPPRVAGDVRVVAYNLQNLFNGDGAGGGFPTSRGARTQAEFDAQLARHVATLRALDADVLALMELENDGHGPRSAEGRLVAALGAPWRAVAVPGRLGDDEIRVGILYRGDRVRPVGRVATLADGPFAERSRVPLARAFVPLDARGAVAGPAFAVVSNHFKSKGCGGAQGADADQRDGQSCFNATRVDSARRLHAWLATDPTGAARGRTLIAGDLNAHAQEDPLVLLHEAGWRDVFALARVADTYSYVFRGERGRLDHALASPALAPHVAGAAKWHANADEPESQGYRDAPGREGPWRGSDHDPLVVGLVLRGAP